MNAMIKNAQAAYFRVIGSLLYNEPEEKTLSVISSERLFTDTPYGPENGMIENGRSVFLAWLSSGSVKELTDAAREDYIRLLVGAGKVLAPPWGSVYLDKDRLLFTEDTLKVRLYYKSRGVKVGRKYKEPDDHIGLELEFIALMLEKGNTGDAEEFARLYMAPWVPRWHEDVNKHAGAGYYKGLADMALGGITELCRL